MLIILSIAAYIFIAVTDKQPIRKTGITLLSVLLPTQINAVINPGTYFTRNSRMRHYCYILFSCRNNERDLKSPVPAERKLRYHRKLLLDFILNFTVIKSKNVFSLHQINYKIMP